MMKSYFTEQELPHVKASETRELHKIEKISAVFMLMGMFMLFLSFISVVSLVLWFGKLTIFITTIIGVPTLGVLFIFVRLVKSYMRTINNIKTRIKEYKERLAQNN